MKAPRDYEEALDTIRAFLGDEFADGLDDLVVARIDEAVYETEAGDDL